MTYDGAALIQRSHTIRAAHYAVCCCGSHPVDKRAAARFGSTEPFAEESRLPVSAVPSRDGRVSTFLGALIGSYLR